MASKKKTSVKSANRLEKPVHSLVGYGVLLILAVVVLITVHSLQWYIIP